jgi:hypothetical protein
MMRWEDLYDEFYDADDRAEIERLKTRLLSDLKAHRLAQIEQGEVTSSSLSELLSQSGPCAAGGVSACRRSSEGHLR